MTVLAHDRTGSGPALALIHPLGAHRGVWRPALPLLREEFDVVAVDMPGFGDSDDLPEDVPVTAANIAAAVRATLESLGLGHAHVAGISLGGWAALEFGKTDTALSVTTLCAAGFWRRVLGPRPEIARTTARRLLPVLRPLVATTRGRRALLSGITAHPERVPAEDAYALVRAYARATGFSRANHEMRSDLFRGFEDIRAPITMAWADRDRSVYPPDRVPAGVEVRRLRDCGHVPTWDSPEQVAAVIREGAARAEEAGRLSA
ncbi:MAG TPA: alpha/beta hydrolase [Thermoleophilaceae bacterium]|nr:alpha/beta hydrolase [Thermoleophilaceae bacterium]